MALQAEMATGECFIFSVVSESPRTARVVGHHWSCAKSEKLGGGQKGRWEPLRVVWSLNPEACWGRDEQSPVRTLPTSYTPAAEQSIYQLH